jgi:hypothetical protein
MSMANCKRCGEDFSNFFNGYHWCPGCGSVFRENFNKKDSEVMKKF